jgi:hypothetical protein
LEVQGATGSIPELLVEGPARDLLRLVRAAVAPQENWQLGCSPPCLTTAHTVLKTFVRQPDQDDGREEVAPPHP